MKSFYGILLAIALLAGALTRLGGCATVSPKCQGDPNLMPCSCMNPASVDCPPPLSDSTRKDGGTHQ